MSTLIVILMFVAFVGVDLLVREGLRRHRERAARQARESILSVAIRTDHAEEAPSLKRVEVPDPKARILAVDDEAVVLDALRRILVLEGYDVDTVESGPEALGLIRQRDYDFVFTDLKMPGMDGVEVVKSVKHHRPDIDVVVVTGFGSIETAVETLQHGACEYIQKPFTAEELGSFMEALRLKRTARIENLRLPVVRVVAANRTEELPPQDHCLAGGTFLSEQHAWARLDSTGHVRLGVDDFTRRVTRGWDSLDLPETGMEIPKGAPLVCLKQGTSRLTIPSPFSGKVVQVNARLHDHPALPMESPYDRGWICVLAPSSLGEELPYLRIGNPAVTWLQDEILRVRQEESKGASPSWDQLQKLFYHQA